MKAVILAGGNGTGLDPLTRITDKHLLPIYDRPMVAHAIESVAKAGVREAMLVTGGPHAGEFFRLLGSGEEHGVERLLYAYQDQPGGIAQTLGLAERFAAEDEVLVLRADNIFGRSLAASAEAFRRQGGGARIVLAQVGDPEHLRRLDVPELRGRQIERIVEKPEDPPSQYAVTGAYFFDERVWEVIGRLEPSTRGEPEITDVNNDYVRRGRMEYDIVNGFWGDAGESIDAYYAVNDFVRFHGANKD